jgi:hypothetical protein
MRIIRRPGHRPGVHGSQVPRTMGNVWNTENRIRQSGMGGPGSGNSGRKQRRRSGRPGPRPGAR